MASKLSRREHDGLPGLGDCDHAGHGWELFPVEHESRSRRWQLDVAGDCRSGAINPTITSTFNSATGGVGYGVAPLVFIPSPPPPGVAASAIAYLSTSSVVSIGVTNQGAGYPVAPPLLYLPNPTDPNYLSGTYTTPAVATVGLEYAFFLWRYWRFARRILRRGIVCCSLCCGMIRGMRRRGLIWVGCWSGIVGGVVRRRVFGVRMS